MNFVSQTLPDNPPELPAWLERQLIGLDLTRLVGELRVVHGQSPNQPSVPLKQILGPYLPSVIDQGLNGVPREVIRALLTHPDALLELQERVLIDGGSYWQRLLDHDVDLDPFVDRGRLQIESLLREGMNKRLPVIEPTSARSWYAQPWFVSLATAAALLLALGLWQMNQTNAEQWGWARPGVLAKSGTAEQYLAHLADAAQEWYRQRPESASEVSGRILEFRRGCSQLLLAPHQPLSAADRAWLRERCRKWADNLDQELAALEAGGNAVEIRTKVDGIVDKLITALRERAKVA
jgi:hypothetical protein